MDFPWKEVVSGVVALTIAAIGYTQWRKGTRVGSYIQDRQQAYKNIWNGLEEIHLFVRTKPFDSDSFNALVTIANTGMMRSDLYLSSEDRDAATDYISSLKEVGRLLAQLPSGTLFHQEFMTTGSASPVPIELLAAWGSYVQAREAVISRFRAAIGAEQI